MNERITRFESLLAADPASKVFSLLAEELLKENDLPRAEEVCRAGLQHHPDSRDGRYTLARVLAAEGEKVLAAGELRTLLDLHPSHLMARRLLAEISGTELPPVLAVGPVRPVGQAAGADLSEITDEGVEGQADRQAGRTMPAWLRRYLPVGLAGLGLLVVAIATGLVIDGYLDRRERDNLHQLVEEAIRANTPTGLLDAHRRLTDAGLSGIEAGRERVCGWLLNDYPGTAGQDVRSICDALVAGVPDRLGNEGRVLMRLSAPDRDLSTAEFLMDDRAVVPAGSGAHRFLKGELDLARGDYRAALDHFRQAEEAGFTGDGLSARRKLLELMAGRDEPGTDPAAGHPFAPLLAMERAVREQPEEGCRGIGEGDRTVGAAVASPRYAARYHYLLGLCRQRAGRPAEAADAFARSVELLPDPECRLLHARSLAAAGSAWKAAGLAAALASERPEMAQAAVLAGRLMHSFRRYDAAWTHLGPLIAGRIDDAGLMALAGDSAERSGRLAEAEEVFERAGYLKPGDPDLRLRLALVMVRQGKQEKAGYLADELARRHPETGYHLLVRAAIERAAGRPDELLMTGVGHHRPGREGAKVLVEWYMAGSDMAGYAKAEAFARAYLGRDEWSGMRLLLADHRYALGDFAGARTEYAACANDPGAPFRCRLRLVLCDIRLAAPGPLPAGVEQAVASIRDEMPEEPLSFVAEGLARLAAGDRSGALELAGQAARRDSREMEAHLLAGDLKFGTSDPIGAADAYQLAIDCDPRCPRAFLHAGIVFFDLRRLARAGEFLDRAEALYRQMPDLPSAVEGLRRTNVYRSGVLMMKGRLDEGYRKIRDMPGRDALLMRMLYFRKIGRPDAELAAVGDLLKGFPGDEEGMFRYGEIQLRMGREGPAAEAFGAYLRRYPEGAFAERARGLLAGKEARAEGVGGQTDNGR